MSFVDREAEEIDDDEENSDVEDQIKKSSNKKKQKRISHFDDEDEDDEEEEEEEEIDYEKTKAEFKDFIDDDVIDNESENDENASDEKSSESENSDLEEDDVELIKQNLDINDTDLVKVGILKKRRRIKQQLESSSDEEVKEPSSKERKKTAVTKESKLSKQAARKQQLNNEVRDLHDDDEEVEEVEAEEEEEDEARENNNNNNEDGEMDNFIVDDSDDENEYGRQKRPRKKVLNDEAQQEALDIFGVNAEELGVLDSDQEAEEGEEEDYEGAYEDEDFDEDDVEEIERVKKKQRRFKAKHKMEDIFEPAELERNYLTEFDQQICIEDEPERFMLRRIPVMSEPNELELEKEAEWIYKQVFETKTSISQQECNSLKPPSVITKIRDTLKFMRNEFLEIPFIASYRKEYITPELYTDETGSKDLWKIYEYDEKYCQLKMRKENLIKLLQRMQKFQFNKLREQSELDDSLSNLNLGSESQRHRLIDSMRAIDDVDIERVKNVQTNEEYFDVYKQFKLYYLADLDEMREQEKKLKKRNKDAGTAAAADDDENVDVGDMADEPDKDYKKSARRKDTYYYCKIGGLNSYAKKFGLSAEQFGENVVAEYQKHEIDQWSVEPNLLAQEYLSERFDTIEKVITGARHVMAMQIARDPNVKQVVRDLYFKRVTLNVKPTQKGVKEIDENHACYPFKYLKEKPVISLKADQYLKIFQAKKDALIEITFNVDSDTAIKFANDQIDKAANHVTEDFDAPVVVPNPEYHAIANMSRQTIYEKFKNLFQKDEFSYNVEQWNSQRAQIVHEALYKVLFPELEQELQSKLINEAKEFVLNACKARIKRLVNVQPYKTDAQQFDENERGCRVFAISYSSDPNEVAICACVNGNGELDEFIRLRKLTARPDTGRYTGPNAAMFAKDREEKREDLIKLRRLIVDKRPHVIAVGAENKDVLQIIDEIKGELEKIEKEKALGSIPVELVDTELAKLYASTKVADAEFREQPLLLKQSVAIARHLQDPLLAYAQLCNPDADILLLKYHLLQDLLTKEEMLSALEHEMIDMTNQVGVDLNRCVAYPHTAYVLQFVSGLGPRKSAHILKTSKYRMPMMNRTFLVTECTLGSKVFVNCAGFIKFDTDTLTKEADNEDENRYVEILDSTRIHPEAYEWARKMAVDALDLDDNDNSNSALKEIQECPDRLKDLDLDAFAAELERTGAGYKNITLYNIKEELYNRYEDKRDPYKPPTQEEKFHMLTKETPSTFYVGKLVLGKVTSIARRRPTREQLEHAEPVKDENTCTWQCPFCKLGNFSEFSQVWTHFDTEECPGAPAGVRTFLDNQISGFIPLKFLSDTQVKNPEDRLKIGQMVYARITKIDIDRFSVDLTCKSSDLKDVAFLWRPKRDDFYDKDAEEVAEMKLEDRKRRDEHRQAYTKRVIAHPQFQNIGYQEAINMLKDMDVGDSIIRPSSKGIDHLTLTWKVNKDIYQHVDIVEEKKINQFSLGKRLIIEGEEYEDLDEILARYVHPMGNNVREVLNYKYYRDLDSTKLEVIENVLTTEYKQNPSRIPYIFVCDRINPGRFLLSYVVRAKVRHECVKVTPEGYKYRNQTHKSFNNLVTWFKKHFNDPISLANAMSVSHSNSSRAGTPAAANQQRNPTASSPFIAPTAPAAATASYPTPRSWMNTPTGAGAANAPTPNRTPNRPSTSAAAAGGASTPYSPTNAATPHLQHFPDDSSVPMEQSSSYQDDDFRRPSNNYNNNNYRGGRGGRGGGRGGFNGDRGNSWNDRGGGGYRGGNRGGDRGGYRGGRNNYSSNDDWNAAPQFNNTNTNSKPRVADEDSWDTDVRPSSSSQSRPPAAAAAAATDDWETSVAPTIPAARSKPSRFDDNWSSNQVPRQQPPPQQQQQQSRAPPPPPPSADDWD